MAEHRDAFLGKAMNVVETQSTPVVDVDWIKAHLGDPGVCLVEIDVSPKSYDNGHIPGAVFWNAYSDLRDVSYTPIHGAEFERLLSRSGVTPDTTVVVYGYGASLGFWLMKAYGHNDVRMLLGSRDQWIEGGAEWSTDASEPAKSSYPLPAGNTDLLASQQDVESAITDPRYLVLDVRSEPEYSGERFWPSGATENSGRSGHVPGAVSLPIDFLRHEDGNLKTADELRAVLEDAGVSKEKTVITYCTIGNRASQAWFALTYLLGYPNVSVYYGSWAEWGTLPGTPIES